MHRITQTFPLSICTLQAEIVLGGFIYRKGGTPKEGYLGFPQTWPSQNWRFLAEEGLSCGKDRFRKEANAEVKSGKKEVRWKFKVGLGI